MYPQHFALATSPGCCAHLAPPVQYCLSGLPWYFFWGLCTRNSSHDRPGLVIHFICVPKREQGGTLTSFEAATLHTLRLSISLFLGIVCTCSASLFLLLWIVNNSNISVNSLHHDFQTVYIVSADRWLRNPQLRTAVELRWLWAALGFALTIGLFPKERADRLLGWLAAAKLYIRTRSAVFIPFRNALDIDHHHDRIWNRPTSSTVCHGSLPVYISRTSSSSHGEAPAIPSLARQSTLALTFNSQVSSVQRSAVFRHTPESDTRSKPCETSQHNESSEPQETSEPGGPPQLSRPPQKSEHVLNPATSMLSLADSAYASSYRTCEESIGRR